MVMWHSNEDRVLFAEQNFECHTFAVLQRVLER
jgi:hypothetical protein